MKKKPIKKRKILTAALALMMATAIGVNWYYTKNPINTSEDNEKTTQKNLGDSIYVNGTTASPEELSEDEENSDDEIISDVSKSQEYFAEAELKRTQTHDKALDEIQKLIESGDSNEQVEKLLEEYTNRIKLETDIENLIKAKIDTECLVIINGENAEVVVEGEAIDELYLLQISDIVSTQTDIPAEKIIIIQAK